MRTLDPFIHVEDMPGPAGIRKEDSLSLDLIGEFKLTRPSEHDKYYPVGFMILATEITLKITTQCVLVFKQNFHVASDSCHSPASLG